MAAPQLSVIIPVKNGGDVFDRCLSAVTRPKDPDVEIVVVDDGSTDSSVQTAEKYGCSVIRVSGSRGPAHARNLGAEEAEGAVLFFIDADIIVLPGTLQTVRAAFKDPEISAITGVLCEKTEHANFSSQFKNLWMRHTYLKLPDTVALFYTSASAVRKELFLASGGFDTGYSRPSVEDTDFGQKLDRMGRKVLLKKDLEVEHVKYYSLPALLKTDFLRSADLTRLTLRNGLKSFAEKNRTSVPSVFMAGIAMYLAAALAEAAGWIFPAAAALCSFAALLFFILFCLCNLSFLTWLGRKKGAVFALQSFLFLIVDVPVVVLGMIWGAAGYIAGYKY